MSQRSLFQGVLIFVVGVSVGWVSKSSIGPGAVADHSPAKPSTKDTGKSAASPDAKEAAAPPVVSKRAIRENTPKSAKAVPTIDPEEMKQAQTQMAKAMAERHKTEFERHLGKLAESLSLTDAQKATASKWIEEQIRKVSEIDLSDPSSMADGGALSSLTTQAMEEQLKASLSDDQKAAFEQFKEKETRAKVDSMALKSLSQLQGVVDFEEGQRDKVYEILAAEAERKAAADAKRSDPASLFTAGMGIDLDPYDLGLQEAMTSGMMEGSGTDEKSIMANLRKVVDERINAKVELLRPVLNEKQLEQYRNELKTKGTGFLGGAMMGTEGESHDSSTIVLPAQ